MGERGRKEQGREGNEKEISVGARRHEEGEGDGGQDREGKRRGQRRGAQEGEGKMENDRV